MCNSLKVSSRVLGKGTNFQRKAAVSEACGGTYKLGRMGCAIFQLGYHFSVKIPELG